MTTRPLWQHLIASAFALAMLTYAFVLGRRVPLLGYADLGFHELGHLLASPFSRTFAVVMGSGTQILVPLGLAAYFWLRSRDRLASGLIAVWAATSMQDASVYIADAPFQRLPLIGGHHDWAYLMSRWGVLDESGDYAGLVLFFGALIGLGGFGIVASAPFNAAKSIVKNKWQRHRARDLPVRAIREFDQPWDDPEPSQVRSSP
ncbi:MAG: hypothetical protein HKN07_09315 [Acidimicrobiia bacterium]|nr:hypothetical protein [Acidimicrobiia bacterium]